MDVAFDNKNTTDLLLDFQLPAASGLTDIVQNAGSMSNTGIDLDLSTTNFKTKDFSWNTRFNFS